jgi:hypothetical protein
VTLVRVDTCIYFLRQLDIVGAAARERIALRRTARTW